MNNKPIGKIRNVWLMILLGIFTLGIYWLVWYYSIFEEMRNQRGQGWSGTLFLVFIFIPPLQLALIAMPWLIPAYVGRMYEENGKEKPITGLSGFWIFVPILGGFIWMFKVQGRLNEYWESLAA